MEVKVEASENELNDARSVGVLSCLKFFSKSQPNQRVWSFLNDHGDVTDSYTYLVRTPYSNE